MNMITRLFLLLGFTAVLITACTDDTPPTPATVAELCTLESSTWVIVEGHLSLPSFLSCQEGKCRLNFGNDGSGVSAEIRASEQPRANMLKMPSDQYSPDDLSIVLDDESLADRHTQVLVTGRVKRPSANVCYLDVSSLQRP